MSKATFVLPAFVLLCVTSALAARVAPKAHGASSKTGLAAEIIDALAKYAHFRADDYVNVMVRGKLMRDQRIPPTDKPPQSDEIVRELKGSINVKAAMDSARSHAEAEWTKNYSEQELKAIAKFINSDLGRRVSASERATVKAYTDEFEAQLKKNYELITHLPYLEDPAPGGAPR